MSRKSSGQSPLRGGSFAAGQKAKTVRDGEQAETMLTLFQPTDQIPAVEFARLYHIGGGKYIISLPDGPVLLSKTLAKLVMSLIGFNESAKGLIWSSYKRIAEKMSRELNRPTGDPVNTHLVSQWLTVRLPEAFSGELSGLPPVPLERYLHRGSDSLHGAKALFAVRTYELGEAPPEMLDA